MCSNLLKTASIMLLLGVLALTACGLDIGEKPQNKSTPKVKINVSSFGQLAQDYFSGEKVQEKRIDESFNTTIEAVQLFSRWERGADSRGLKPEEVRGFLNRFVLEGSQISPEMMAALMNLKVLLAGGSPELLKYQEMDSLVSWLEFIKDEAKAMRSHMPILSSHSKRSNFSASETTWQVRQAEQALIQTANRLGQRLDATGRSFRFVDLNSLISQGRSLLNWSEIYPDSRAVGQWMRLFESVYPLAAGLGEKEETTLQPLALKIQSGTWTNYLTAGGEWYAAAVRFNVEIRPLMSTRPQERTLKVFYGEGLDSFVAYMNHMFHLSQRMIQRQPHSYASYKHIRKVALSFEEWGFLPWGLSGKTVAEYAPVVFNKVFGPTQCGGSFCPPDLRQSPGITLDMMEQLAGEFSLWAQVQERLPQTITEVGGLPYYEMGAADQNLVQMLSPQRHLVEWGKLIRKLTHSSLDDELSQMVNSEPVLYKNYRPTVVLVNQSEYKDRNLYNSSIFNVMRTLLRVAVLGWSEDQQRRQNMVGLSRSEVSRIYEQSHRLAVNLQMGDPRKNPVDVGARVCGEGKTFTYMAQGIPFGDGVPIMNFEEGVVLLTYMNSASVVGEQLYRDLSQLCPLQSPVYGVYNEPKIYIPCFRRHFRALLTKGSRPRIANLPGMVKYLNGLSQGQWHDLESSLVELAWYKDEKDLKHLGKTDIMTMSMVLHYIESIMTRHDQSGEGSLDYNELENASDVFAGLVANIARQQGQELTPELARETFKFIAYYGRIPDSESLWDKVRVGSAHLTKWIKMDRKKLVSVFHSMMAVNQLEDSI